MGFTHYQQLDQMDCGPTCLRMVAKRFGRSYSLDFLRNRSNIGKLGVSLNGIAECAESIGFKSLPVSVGFKKLQDDAPLPCIAHWENNHFVTIYKIRKTLSGQTFVYVADPAKGKIKYSQNEFESKWTNPDSKKGILLLLEPTPSFFEENHNDTQGNNFRAIFSQLWIYKRLIGQLVLGLIAGSIIQLIFPFLTQSIVDIGIERKSMSFLTLILIGQLVLSIARISVDFIRSWILMNISMRLNLSILSDFVIKLLKLPLSYFDTKQLGDLLQRVGDHTRIENFLTSQSLNFLFSIFNLIVFGIVLAIYNGLFFLIFLFGSILYASWILLFLKKRRELDFKEFDFYSKSNSQLVQLLQGVQEVKIANANKEMRWDWENTRIGLFGVQIKNLALSQYQQAGGFALNETKNILIIYLSAVSVIDGSLTFGSMLAIQYLIGQLSSPVELLLDFVRQFQDAKISLERMNEVHRVENEENENQKPLVLDKGEKISIELNNICFRYPGSTDFTLRHIDLFIPVGKTTAIVGTSGSGKTTLLKLLLNIYQPSEGEIRINQIDLNTIKPTTWRKHCGVVLQDGFIFAKTLAENISIGCSGKLDVDRLKNSLEIANLNELVNTLPNGFHTVIGDAGQGLSQGQKQRILIARAVYKNPSIIFFDEATNALDSKNERVIMENLYGFFKHRTAVVVAHRLSTVRQADQIVVIDKGIITEIGTHANLVKAKGYYYDLVKNQLELGNG